MIYATETAVVDAIRIPYDFWDKDFAQWVNARDLNFNLSVTDVKDGVEVHVVETAKTGKTGDWLTFNSNTEQFEIVSHEEFSNTHKCLSNCE